MAERFADDEATEEALTAAYQAACDAEAELVFGHSSARRGEGDAEALDILDAARAASAASSPEDRSSLASDCACDAGGKPVLEAQQGLLLEIVGNPFRPVALNSVWLTPAVLSLAQAAYKYLALPAGTLDPDRLAVLADALEEAGCTNPDILGHLRGPGPHVRGCHIVDMLLDKT
jgi:hypothetical protein